MKQIKSQDFLFQKLGEVLLVQSYCNYWDANSRILFSILKKFFTERYPTLAFKYFFQSRNKKQKIVVQEYDYKNEFKVLNKDVEFTCREFGIDYNLSVGRSYDIGIYTDMSSIRDKMREYLNEGDSLLNLFSYTGAFSTFALSNGLREVVSVDLSQNYLDTLNRNIELNELPKSNHSAEKSSVDEYLDRALKSYL